MIEPAIAAAIFTASGTLIGKLLELVGKREPTAKAREVVDKTYTTGLASTLLQQTAFACCSR